MALWKVDLKVESLVHKMGLKTAEKMVELKVENSVERMDKSEAVS